MCLQHKFSSFFSLSNSFSRYIYKRTLSFKRSCSSEAGGGGGGGGCLFIHLLLLPTRYGEYLFFCLLQTWFFLLMYALEPSALLSPCFLLATALLLLSKPNHSLTALLCSALERARYSSLIHNIAQTKQTNKTYQSLFFPGPPP